jgi:hypothetical protein
MQMQGNNVHLHQVKKTGRNPPPGFHTKYPYSLKLNLLVTYVHHTPAIRHFYSLGKSLSK